MKILMINVVCGIRSTGRICSDLAVELDKQGHEVKIAYGREDVPKELQKYAIRIGNNADIRLHGIMARMLDKSGFGSKSVTVKFIEWIKKFNPDIIHLHNLHGYYINLEILFNYLRTCGKKIVWTIHDCWSFTGHCVYFDYVQCDKWKAGCGKCTQKSSYPRSWIFDRSKQNYNNKKRILSGIKNMVLVTPSIWLSNLLKMSYLNNYKIEVINNGIDIQTFKTLESNIYLKYKIPNKKIILGVASIWEERKGLSDFIRLSNLINEEWIIVLVGMSKKQTKLLPANIIGIPNTNSIDELVRLYSVATVFVNMTYEDNYPTVNLEAIACGTPVITYNTGGSPESAFSNSKNIVDKGDFNQIWKIIYEQKYVKADVTLEDISKKSMYKKYIELYKNCLEFSL